MSLLGNGLALLFLISAGHLTSAGILPKGDYPNPKYDSKSCNRPFQSFVCDSDAVLTDKQAAKLDRLATEMISSTTCLCPNCLGDANGVSIGIYIRYNITDLKGNITSRDLKSLAEQVRQTWRFGPCGDDIVIVLLAQTRQAEIDMGSVVEQALSRRLARKIFNDCIGHFENDYFYQGLESMLNSYRDVLCRIHVPETKGAPSNTGLIVGLATGILVLLLLLSFAAVTRYLQIRKLRSLQSKSNAKSCSGTRNIEAGEFEYRLCEDDGVKAADGSSSSDEGIDSDDDGRHCDSAKPKFNDLFRRQLSDVQEENEEEMEAIKFAMVNRPKNIKTHITEL